MSSEDLDSTAVNLFQYLVASSDLYYAEQEQRDVFLGKDWRGHIRLWGQTANSGPTTRIGLCRVFLEYGLYCTSWCSITEAQYHMQDFGERLGHCLADYLRANPGILAADDPTLRALEQVFETIGADFSEQQLDAGVRFLATHCLLEESARRSGLPDVELARHGIHAMCRALLLDMDPGLVVKSSSDNEPDFVYILTTPAFA